MPYGYITGTQCWMYGVWKLYFELGRDGRSWVGEGRDREGERRREKEGTREGVAKGEEKGRKRARERRKGWGAGRYVSAGLSTLMWIIYRSK